MDKKLSSRIEAIILKESAPLASFEMKRKAKKLFDIPDLQTKYHDGNQKRSKEQYLAKAHLSEMIKKIVADSLIKRKQTLTGKPSDAIDIAPDVPGMSTYNE